jgi:hypothetical protein
MFPVPILTQKHAEEYIVDYHNTFYFYNAFKHYNTVTYPQNVYHTTFSVSNSIYRYCTTGYYHDASDSSPIQPSFSDHDASRSSPIQPPSISDSVDEYYHDLSYSSPI